MPARLRMVVTHNGREVHGWEKWKGSIAMVWGLLLIPLTFPIRLIMGKWPVEVARVEKKD